jgi:hypothetical protein
MTTLAPPPAEVARPGGISPYVSIFADLMPDEVLATRRLRDLKRKIVIGMAGLVVLLLAAYAVSWLQTVSSRSDLTSEQNRATSLTKTMLKYRPLLDAQQQSSAITTTLSGLMKNDLQWQALIANVRKVAPAGMTLVTMTGSVVTTTGGTTSQVGGNSLDVLNQTGQLPVGSITLTGSAHDKSSIAAFADKLTTVKGLAAPFVTSVTGAKGDVTFSINALITDNALGGRFTVKAPTTTTGGK